MHQVAVGWFHLGEPALRKRVLTVQAAALVAVLVGTLRRVGRNVGVNVPDERLALYFVYVGDGVGIPQVVIRQYRRVLYDFVEGCLQLLTVLAVSTAVVVLCPVGTLRLCCHRHGQQPGQME